MQKHTDISSFVSSDEFEKARSEGNHALRIADLEFCQLANLSHNIISFSLFGDEPAYCEGAILNAIALPHIYPGWEMKVFHDETVPESVLHRLRALQVGLISVKDFGIESWPGTFWRFMAVLIPNTNLVMFRDTDSVIGERESQLVKDWRLSQKPFHIIRDWFSHQELILAGLWGAYAPFLNGMRQDIEQYLEMYKMKLHPTHADQNFLAEMIWPKIKHYTLVHDSIHNLEGITPFPAPDMENSGKNALGGYRLKKFEIDFQALSQDIDYKLRILDEQKNLVCEYERKTSNGKDAFSLPYEYTEKINLGAWELSIV